jgi:predicted secreted protein
MPREKIGVPITPYWRIKTLKYGEAQIFMKYYRPWEGPEKALEKFTIKVTISKKGE